MKEKITTQEALMRMVNGHQVSQALYVAASLGIADLLAGRSRTSKELAARARAHEPSLYRVLRALASVGVFAEARGRRFSHTALSRELCSDKPSSVGTMALFAGQPHNWAAWGQLLYAVKTGKNAFRRAHGIDVWTYRRRNKSTGAVFDRAMAANTARTLRAVSDYRFSSFKHVVDIGGGQGVFLAEILSRNKGLRGTLFDQPHVVPVARKLFKRKSLTARAAVVEGSFFRSVPGGGDLYLLKHILNDWEDKECVKILRSCRRAMGPAAKLLILTHLVAPPNQGRDTKFRDLHMFVSPGGRKRTTEEYKNLLAEADFKLRSVLSTNTELDILECVPLK
jgi:hypothetical protein